MIPEQREQAERTSKDGGVYDVDQKLQSYLRDKYSVDALALPHQKDAAEQLLTQVAKDWCIKHNQQLSESEYDQKAKEAIDTYLSNWQNKQQGEDDRGHRFGKSCFL